MGRRSKQEEKLLAQYAAMTGQDLGELQAVASKNKLDVDNPHRTKSMQMEAALDYIRKPQGYKSRQCKECGDWFGTNYAHVAYCSDTCRAKEWERTMKVPWNISGKDIRERWGGEVPIVIHPTVWNNIKTIIEQMQELRDEGKAVVDSPHQEDDEFPLEEQEESPSFLTEYYSPPTEETISEEETSPQQLPSSSVGFLDLPEPSPFLL